MACMVRFYIDEDGLPWWLGSGEEMAVQDQTRARQFPSERSALAGIRDGRAELPAARVWAIEHGADVRVVVQRGLLRRRRA